jgi:hypothetical protein
LIDPNPCVFQQSRAYQAPFPKTNHLKAQEEEA